MAGKLSFAWSGLTHQDAKLGYLDKNSLDLFGEESVISSCTSEKNQSNSYRSPTVSGCHTDLCTTVIFPQDPDIDWSFGQLSDPR